MRALRRNANRYRQALSAVTQSGQQTNDIVIRELKPETRADGTVIYTLRDGGKVTDDGRQVRIERESHNARSLTLTLKAARSKMGEVALDGTDAQAFIEAAARDKLQLNFRNSSHDQERKRLVAAYEREDAVLAASGFVARQNAARGADASILPHRLWQVSDVGSAHYEGAVDLGEGIHAILVRKEGEIVVLPRTASEAAPTPAPGAEVAVSEQGQVGVHRGHGR